MFLPSRYSLQLSTMAGKCHRGRALSVSGLVTSIMYDEVMGADTD